MTIQPFYTHSERYAAQGVYNQLKNKEKTIGLSEHEIGEMDIMKQRLRLPVPENWITTKHEDYTIRVHKDLVNTVSDSKPIGFSESTIVMPTKHIEANAQVLPTEYWETEGYPTVITLLHENRLMKIETLSLKVRRIIEEVLMIPCQGSGYTEAIHLSELGATQADISDIVLSCENKFDVEFPEGWINDGKEKTPRDVIDTICELKDIVR